MDFTTIPRPLIYKERKRIIEFGVKGDNLLNTELFELLRDELSKYIGDDNHTRLLRDLFNESYYLCTVFLLDKDAIMNYNVYIDGIFKEFNLPIKFQILYQNIVSAISIALLKDIAISSKDIRYISNELKRSIYEFMPLVNKTNDLKHPDESEFQPVELTEELLATIDWKEVTDNYEFVKTDFILRNLGKNSFEKKRLASSIYSAMSNSGEMYSIPYQIDSLIFETYEKYGGKRNELLDMVEKQVSNGMNEESCIHKYSNPPSKHLLKMKIKKEGGITTYTFERQSDDFVERKVMPPKTEISSPHPTQKTFDISNYPFIIKSECAERVINKLLSLVKDKKGPKDKVMPVRAAIDAGAIRRPTFAEIQDTFGKGFVSNSSYHNYTNPDQHPYDANPSFTLLVSEFKKIVE